MIRKLLAISLFLTLILILNNRIQYIRGGGPWYDAGCDDDRLFIVSGDNASHHLWIKSGIYSDLEGNLSIEGIPQFWAADLDKEHVILESGGCVNITLNVSSPLNATVGFIAEIKVVASFRSDETYYPTIRVPTYTEIIGPELIFGNSSITFSPENPKAGETMVITSQIQNIGKTNATDVHVKFFVDDTQIEGDQIINRIMMNESTFVSVNWTATAGEHTIRVEIDPGDLIDEYDEENNTATKTIAVSAVSQNHLFRYILVLVMVIIYSIILFVFWKKSK